MLAARAYCINELSSIYEPARVEKIVIKQVPPAGVRPISAPGSPSAKGCEHSISMPYDSDLDDLPELVDSSEDEDDQSKNLLTVTVDSGASMNIHAPGVPAANLRRSSRKVSPLTHFKLGAKKPAVGSRNAPPTTKPEVAAPTPGAAVTKRKVRESTPPTPAPKLVMVYLDDAVAVNTMTESEHLAVGAGGTHSKPARKVRARPSRTSSQGNTSGVSASADPLDYDST